MGSFSKGIKSLLEAELVDQLAEYNNLPYFLALIYLKHRKGSYVVVNKDIVSVDSYSGEVLRYKNLKSFKRSTPIRDRASTFPSSIYLTQCFLNNNQSDIKLGKEVTYIYSRNEKLVDLITRLVEKHYKDSVPYYMVLPYLFFNQEKELYANLVRSFGANWTKEVNIKYNAQKQTIKYKNPYTPKSYTILSGKGLHDLYKDPSNYFLKSFKYLEDRSTTIVIPQPSLIPVGSQILTSTGIVLTTTNNTSSNYITVSGSW